MADTAKIFRDPIYNYISIDRGRDAWLLDLIDAPAFQRLRRIHQLGVSHYTYPGADHNRLAHTLGVMHLMSHALTRVEKLESGPSVERARHVLLASALLHDIGHGPFSHLSEQVLGVEKHEAWSCAIIRETTIGRILERHDIPVSDVVALIDKHNRRRPPWQKALLSSELDVDRMDYLRRDSYFTGGGYGHFDWFRILSSFALDDGPDGSKILVWPEQAMYAIEEYIFARFYMYSNVYQHKTTRGFEKLIHSAFRRARAIVAEGKDAGAIPETAPFFNPSAKVTVEQYLTLDDATFLYQFSVWSRHEDAILADLSRRILARDRLAAVEDPVTETAIDGQRDAWEAELRRIVATSGYDPDYYMLRDDLKLTIYDPYMPEKEEREQDPYNAIFVSTGGKTREISTVLQRLAAVTGVREKRYRYYVPPACRQAAQQLAGSRAW
jgi:HD superfamily phosphohydrolase